MLNLRLQTVLIGLKCLQFLWIAFENDNMFIFTLLFKMVSYSSSNDRSSRNVSGKIVLG